MAKPKHSNHDQDASNKHKKLAGCVRKSVKRYLKDLNGEDASNVYEMVMTEVEKPLLEVIMHHSDGNQSKASRMLGINRNTLRKKLDTHRIEN